MSGGIEGAGRVSDRRGFTLVEVVVSVLIFALMMGGLVSAGLVASSQLMAGETEVRAWKAASYQMETLLGRGYDDLASGSDTIEGLATRWTVTGTTFKQIVLVVDRRTFRGEIRPDSFVTYVADPTP